MTTAFDARGVMQSAAPPMSAAPMGGAAISSAAAARLFGQPADRLTAGATGKPVTASWTYEWHMSKTPARNVVAVLPRSDPTRASEYVLVGAHNDHIGTSPTPIEHDSLRAVNMVTRPQGNNDPACRPTMEQQHRIDSLIARARHIRPAQMDSIFNGADDDGSGTAVLLEIAEKIREREARPLDHLRLARR